MKKPALDAGVATDNLLLTLGGALAATRGETAEEIWRAIPIVKALAELGRRNPMVLQAIYDRVLREPMPLHSPPLVPQENDNDEGPPP